MSATFVRTALQYIGQARCAAPGRSLSDIPEILLSQQLNHLSEQFLHLERMRSPMKSLTEEEQLFPVYDRDVFFLCLLTGSTVLSGEQMRQYAFRHLNDPTAWLRSNRTIRT